MKTIKVTNEYTIYQRRDGRYAVEAKKGGYINGDDKVAILKENDLIKVAAPAPAEPEPVEEQVEATEEAPAEATPAEQPIAETEAEVEPETEAEVEPETEAETPTEEPASEDDAKKD